MKTLSSLIWKEWHEARIYLWIGLGIFLGLPAIEGLEAVLSRQTPRFEVDASPWVTVFGGVLAIFVAVHATCRDFHGHIEDFWRSRPVGIVRWMLTKYLVGLSVVLVSCSLPLIAELCINRDSSVAYLMLWLPFFWTALYSIGFLAGCLLRQTADAAMLALAAMLLVWFLPLIVPPLNWLNVSAILLERPAANWRGDFIFGDGQLKFAAGMVVMALSTLLAALWAVRRDWIIESGKNLMYGSVATAVLLLFASAAFQMGTNMPILQQVDLLESERVAKITIIGTQGFVVTDQPGVARYRKLQITPTAIILGAPVDWSRRDWTGYQSLTAPQDLDVGYFGREDDNGNVSLLVNFYPTASQVASLPLWKFEPPKASQNDFRSEIYARQNRLYVWGSGEAAGEDRLDTFDIGDPIRPRLISDIPFQYRARVHAVLDGLVDPLPPIPDLPPIDRLKMKYSFYGVAFDGNIMCDHLGDLSEYRLTKLTDDAATFKKIGEFHETYLNEVFGSYAWWRGMHLQNGLLYVTTQPGNGWLNPIVTVFDMGVSHPFRPVGHFAAPGATVVCPLPDGRAIVGGTKIWLIGPPPRHAGN